MGTTHWFCSRRRAGLSDRINAPGTNYYPTTLSAFCYYCYYNNYYYYYSLSPKMPQGHRDLQASQEVFWASQTVQDVINASQLQAASQQKDTSPLAYVDLPDLVPVAPKGDEAEPSTRGAPRRSVAEMQLEMFERGAFFFRFGSVTTDPKGRAISRTASYEKGAADYRCDTLRPAE